MKKLFLLFLISCVLVPVWAATTSPYAGQDSREIKALSPQEISDYLEGKGMGYAKAAELNSYPGPKHVLDLAETLELTPEQVTRTQTNFDAMRRSAVDLGKSLIEKERQIDDLFSSGSVRDSTLKPLLAQVGELQSQIRFIHLQAHLQQKAILSGAQIQRYNHLRGYGGTPNDGHHHGH